jgi:hypothetical protein
MLTTLIKTNSRGEEEVGLRGKAKLPNGNTEASPMLDGCLMLTVPT